MGLGKKIILAILIGVAVLVAVLTGLTLLQDSQKPRIIETSRPSVTTTTGVVKSFVFSFLHPFSRESVTVALADGSLVAATVLPGCIVHSGDPVQVHILGPADRPLYLVSPRVEAP